MTSVKKLLQNTSVFPKTPIPNMKTASFPFPRKCLSNLGTTLMCPSITSLDAQAIKNYINNARFSTKNTSSKSLEIFRRQPATNEDVLHIQRYTTVHFAAICYIFSSTCFKQYSITLRIFQLLQKFFFIFK